jgi:hypothetical protein
MEVTGIQTLEIAMTFLFSQKKRGMSRFESMHPNKEGNMESSSKTRLLLASLMVVVAAGCYTAPRTDNESSRSNLTAGMVKVQVIKGETTQAEVLEIFGAPNIVTKNRDNDEVWNYNRMSFESTSSSGNILGIFWTGLAAGAGSASKASSTATTKSFDLILIFDSNDVVKDYSVIAASF